MLLHADGPDNCTTMSSVQENHPGPVLFYLLANEAKNSRTAGLLFHLIDTTSEYFSIDFNMAAVELYFSVLCFCRDHVSFLNMVSLRNVLRQ